MPDLRSRVTIMAVGVSKYNDLHFQELRGPYRDLENLKELLVNNPKTALFKPNQFIELRDPTSSQLRQVINEYVIGRSADGDILVFYFSGHGVPIGTDDFGFCTTDTSIHHISGATLPLSAVKVSELLQSLNIANVIPVVIIDACYSGIAGKSLTIPAIDAIAGIDREIQSIAASSYALLCSCADFQSTIDTSLGGVFSRLLVDVCNQGIAEKNKNPQYLSLSEIFPELKEMAQQLNKDAFPKLYLGQTLPNFSLVANTLFQVPKKRRYTLSPSYVHILEVLWEKGKDGLSPDEIRELCGNGAYGNHNKLSLEPWRLVENVENSRNRKLTQRGIQFLANKLSVPKTIVQDPQTQKTTAAENSALVNHEYFVK
jgi:hypothetical protein